MNTAIIITVIICATLFLSLAAVLFAAVRISKHNQINAKKRMEGDDDGTL